MRLAHNASECAAGYLTVLWNYRSDQPGWYGLGELYMTA